MKRTIQVTADHIARGKPRSPCHCPVALALREAGFPNASVGVTVFVLNRQENDDECIPLPEPALIFIPAFDEGCPDLQPFSFQIEEPETTKP